MSPALKPFCDLRHFQGVTIVTSSQIGLERVTGELPRREVNSQTRGSRVNAATKGMPFLAERLGTITTAEYFTAARRPRKLRQ